MLISELQGCWYVHLMRRKLGWIFAPTLALLQYPQVVVILGYIRLHTLCCNKLPWRNDKYNKTHYSHVRSRPSGSWVSTCYVSSDPHTPICITLTSFCCFNYDFVILRHLMSLLLLLDAVVVTQISLSNCIHDASHLRYWCSVSVY